MQTWQLPEYIADILPANARQVESAKERLLELFRVYGYELVMPPLIEYTTSLLTKTDPGISLQTIRVVDQLSGRQLGFRSDITPQIARIDAHLLSAHQGLNRLCYAGSVLHARPASLLATREPYYVGAELYGFEEIEADLEIIDLMLKSLRSSYVDNITLSLGHLGVFGTLAQEAHLSAEDAYRLLGIMQSKDRHAVNSLIEELSVTPDLAEAFKLLPELYGDKDILAKAKEKLPKLPGIEKALTQLSAVCCHFAQENLHIDFAELRKDTYHTGLLFAAYSPKWSDAIARGGRYDGLGRIFGRARAATGFTLDLRDLIKILAKNTAQLGIKISADDYKKAFPLVEALRSQGEAVVIDYLGQTAQSLRCNRQLVYEDGQWQVSDCN